MAPAQMRLWLRPHRPPLRLQLTMHPRIASARGHTTSRPGGRRSENPRDLMLRLFGQPHRPEAPRSTRATRPLVHYSGWIIQVGAFDVEREARDRLNARPTKVGEKLKHASPFTERCDGDKTFYRARFAGIQKMTQSHLPATKT